MFSANQGTELPLSCRVPALEVGFDALAYTLLVFRVANCQIGSWLIIMWVGMEGGGAGGALGARMGVVVAAVLSSTRRVVVLALIVAIVIRHGW